MGGSARSRVDTQARRDALDDVLSQLARTMAQLETAVAAFPPDFDFSTFDAAWYSKAPEERNRAMLVRSNMDDLHNLCSTLIARSGRVAQDLGAIPADRKTPAADQLRTQHLYPREVEQVMQEVIELRNQSQHEYWGLTPNDVYRAVNNQRQHLPSFIADLATWIQGLPGR
ncbi:MAG: HepT-like ribonuclease domain-containing protein [Solirubrobacteraceae bacterium]